MPNRATIGDHSLYDWCPYAKEVALLDADQSKESTRTEEGTYVLKPEYCDPTLESLMKEPCLFAQTGVCALAAYAVQHTFNNDPSLANP